MKDYKVSFFFFFASDSVFAAVLVLGRNMFCKLEERLRQPQAARNQSLRDASWMEGKSCSSESFESADARREETGAPLTK